MSKGDLERCDQETMCQSGDMLSSKEGLYTNTILLLETLNFALIICTLSQHLAQACLLYGLCTSEPLHTICLSCSMC